MTRRHSSSVAIPRIADAGPRMLRLRADRELSAVFEEPTAGEAGRIIVKSREPLRRGEPVRVEVSFGPMADEVVLGGRVDSIEEQPSAAPRVAIRILAEYRERAQYVRAVLCGARSAHARNYRRVPTDLPARWHTSGHRVAGRIRDLSHGGAFVVSRRAPAVGSDVWLEVRHDLELRGIVSWVRAGGTEPGFGVSFKLRDRAIAAELQRVVRDNERS